MHLHFLHTDLILEMIKLPKYHFRLHFAGSESATVWCGFMNGAVESGVRAAVEVLHHLRPQSLSPLDLANPGRALDIMPNTDVKNSKQSNIAMSVIKVAVGCGALVLIGFGVKKVYDKVQSC